MKRFLIAFWLVFACFALTKEICAGYFLQQSEGPKVFIDSQAYARTQTGLFGGVTTDSSILSTPEIAGRFSRACPECRVTIKKEAADYVVIFAASQAFGGGSYSWAVYENKEGLLVRKGFTVLFNNSVRDSIAVVMAHWHKEPIEKLTMSSDADPIKNATIYLFRKEGGFKSSFNPIIDLDGTELARLTKNKFIVISIAPGSHLFQLRLAGTMANQMTVEIAPGSESFLKYDSGSLTHLHARLTPVDQIEAMKQIRKLKKEENKNIMQPALVVNR